MCSSHGNQMHSAQSVPQASANDHDGDHLEDDKHSKDAKLSGRCGRQTEVITPGNEHRRANCNSPIDRNGSDSPADSADRSSSRFWKPQALSGVLAQAHIAKFLVAGGVV